MLALNRLVRPERELCRAMEETSEREKRNELGEKEKHFFIFFQKKKKNRGSTQQVKNVNAFNKFIYFYLKEPAGTQTETVIFYFLFF
jgi:hypothetical protein